MIDNPFQTAIRKMWINADGDLLIRRAYSESEEDVVVLRTLGSYLDGTDPCSRPNVGTPDEWREVELPRG